MSKTGGQAVPAARGQGRVDKGAGECWLRQRCVRHSSLGTLVQTASARGPAGDTEDMGWDTVARASFTWKDVEFKV